MLTSIKHWLLTIVLTMGFSICTESSNTPLGRVIVMGDLHADIGVAREVFRLAGATDENDSWIGGELVVIQLGDLIGRSDDDREVLDFIFEVQEQAETAGGRVYVVLGNHEIFAARMDYRWTGDNAFAAFESAPGLNLDDPRLQSVPEPQRARGAALMPGGPYANRLAEFPVVLKLGSTVFTHGGVNLHWANYGVDKINDEVSRWFRGETVEPVSTLGVDAGNDDDGVMWSRRYSQNVDEADCRMLEESLSILGAKRMVVAHTVHKEITSRCGEMVWAIDVGMSRVYGGKLQVLEIVDDQVIRVIQR